MVAQFTPSVRPALPQLAPANEGSDYTVAGESNILGRDAAGGREGVERRCVVPPGARRRGMGFAYRLVAEEAKILFFQMGPPTRRRTD